MTTSSTITSGVRRWKPYPSYKVSGLGTGVQIPSHWSVMRLKHIAAVRPSNVDKKTVEGQEPVRLCNYVDVYKNDTITPDMDFMRASATPAQIAAYTLKAGDVIITKDSETWMDIAVPAHVTCDLPGVLCGYHLALVRPRKEVVDGAFLFRCFSAAGVLDQFRVAANGITRFGLGTGAIADALFPLPPLDEQRRIVEFLDRETAKIDALIAKKERLIELLQEKRTALISHAVTKGLDLVAPTVQSDVEWLGEIPAGWSTTRLARFIGNIEQGWSPLADEQKAEEGEWGVTKLGAVCKGRFRSEEHKALPVAVEPETRFEVRDGDFLVTRANTPDLVGDACVVRNPRPKLMLCDLIYRIQVDERLVLKQWLALSMLSRLGRYQITREARGSSQSMVKLSQGHIRSFVIARPSLAEQEQIIRAVERETHKIDTLIAMVQQAIDKLREYRTALISAAVTGKIDVSSEAVAVASPTIAPEKPAAKPANVFFRRSVFAAEIIDRLCDEPTFGHVKFQKCLFVAQHHLRVGDFEESYKRMAAGPYDNALIHSVDSQVGKRRWFKAEKVGDRYTYRRLDKAGGHRQYFDRYFGVHAEQLGKLLDLFRPLDTDRAEIVATLYAVWNDFLLRGEPCDDDRLVAEVLTNWHDRKKRFDEDRWRRALGWMREKGLVPTGFGKPTVPGDDGNA